MSFDVSGSVTGYKIYRKENDGKYKRVKTTKKAGIRTWKDTSVKKGIYYTYKVEPYFTSGGKTYKGEAVAATGVKLTGTLSKVSGVKVQKNKADNTVSWKKNRLAAGYKVYRKVGSGSYKLVKTTTSASFVDKSVQKGKKYTYKIKAYYKNYTYNNNTGKYTSKDVTSKYSKTVTVKR